MQLPVNALVLLNHIFGMNIEQLGCFTDILVLWHFTIEKDQKHEPLVLSLTYHSSN